MSRAIYNRYFRVTSPDGRVRLDTLRLDEAEHHARTVFQGSPGTVYEADKGMICEIHEMPAQRPENLFVKPARVSP